MVLVESAVAKVKSGTFVVEEIEPDGPADNKVLTKVHATGVCHTDTT